MNIATSPAPEIRLEFAKSVLWIDDIAPLRIRKERESPDLGMERNPVVRLVEDAAYSLEPDVEPDSLAL